MTENISNKILYYDCYELSSCDKNITSFSFYYDNDISSFENYYS